MRLAIIILALIPSLLVSIDYRTVPVEFPAGTQFGSNMEQGIIEFDAYVRHDNGVLVQFPGGDSLYFYNGNDWQTFSDYRRSVLGSVNRFFKGSDGSTYMAVNAKDINPNNPILSLKLYRLQSNLKWEEVILPFDTFEGLDDISSKGYRRSLYDLNIDKDGNISALTDHSIFYEKEQNGATSSAANELIIVDKNNRVTDYKRSNHSVYSGYNFRDTLVDAFFSSLTNIHSLSDNTLLIAGRTFFPDSLESPAPVFLYQEEKLTTVDIGFEETIRNPSEELFECRKIIDVDGKTVIFQGISNSAPSIHFSYDLNNWTSIGRRDTDIVIDDYNEDGVTRIFGIHKFNNELYIATSEGIIILNNDNDLTRNRLFLSDEGVYQDRITDIIFTETSLWVKSRFPGDFRSTWFKVETVSSVEEDQTSHSTVTYTSYYDTMGNELIEKDIQSGIPYLELTKYKDGGFKVEKRVMR